MLRIALPNDIDAVNDFTRRMMRGDRLYRQSTMPAPIPDDELVLPAPPPLPPSPPKPPRRRLIFIDDL